MSAREGSRCGKVNKWEREKCVEGGNNLPKRKRGGERGGRVGGER